MQDQEVDYALLIASAVPKNISFAESPNVVIIQMLYVRFGTLKSVVISMEWLQTPIGRAKVNMVPRISRVSQQRNDERVQLTLTGFIGFQITH